LRDGPAEDGYRFQTSWQDGQPFTLQIWINHARNPFARRAAISYRRCYSYSSKRGLHFA
jgi:hypothetical protein